MTFLRILSETVRVFKWRCAAYCLMTNHYHAVVVTPEPNVGMGMKRLNGLYAQGSIADTDSAVTCSRTGTDRSTSSLTNSS